MTNKMHLKFTTPVDDCTDRIPFPVNEISSLIIHNLYLHGTNYNPTKTNNLYITVRVSGYRYRGPGFDSRRYQIF